MKYAPAPRIAGQPVPPGIRINPLALGAIRSPIGIVRNGARLPTKSVPGHIDPGPVWCQGAVKIIFCHVLWLLGLAGRRRLRRLGRGTRAQFMTPLNYSRLHIGWRSQIIQIRDVCGAEIEGRTGLGNIGQGHVLRGAGLHHANDLAERTVGVDVRRQQRRCCGIEGRRGRYGLLRTLGVCGTRHQKCQN